MYVLGVGGMCECMCGRMEKREMCIGKEGRRDVCTSLIHAWAYMHTCPRTSMPRSLVVISKVTFRPESFAEN